MTNIDLQKKYSGKDNFGHSKIIFVNKMLELDDGEFSKKCEHYIWLSAYANNNPRSDYHWMCDVCYDICHNRNRIDIYEEAWERVCNSAYSKKCYRPYS